MHQKKGYPMAKFQAKKVYWLTLFLSIFAICLSVKGFSHQPIFRESGGLSSVIGTVVGHKYYVDPGSVYVVPEGIYINLEGNFLNVCCLAQDDIGVYVSVHECTAKAWWECTRCHKMNPSSRRTCMACGFDPANPDDS